jgi:hypothetical protein
VIVCYEIPISSLSAGHGDNEPTILDVMFTGGGSKVGYGGAALKTTYIIWYRAYVKVHHL